MLLRLAVTLGCHAWPLQVRRCLEVNVMGVVNVTQHFQPLLPTHRDLPTQRSDPVRRGGVHSRVRSRVVVVTSDRYTPDRYT